MRKKEDKYDFRAFGLAIILLNSSSKMSFTPSALKTRPTATRDTTRKPISLENSLLNPRYSPITTIASSTRDWALDKNQL